MKFKLLLIISILCITGSFSHAQQGLSGAYTDVYFSSMVDDLEKKYDLRFYYSPELDSTKISLHFQGLSPEQLATQITELSNINFLVKDEKTLIATGEFKISKNLSPTLFNLKTKKQELESKPSNSVLQNIRELTEFEKTDELENKVVYLGEASKRFDGNSATITGYIKESKTGEPVIGATVMKKEPLIGAITDQYGYFTIVLPKGKHELIISSTGMKTTKRQIILYSDANLNVDLKDDIISLKEVVVTGENDVLDNLQTGFANLNIKNIKQIPSIMGEADIMKIALTLPGVQTAGEGAAGFNVRGGAADQNLVLLNDVPIYNTNHLFGFFSVFNPDVIASANLYKSGIGAQYGGRIASVFDVALRDGNKKKFQYKGGISPVTAKFTIEGPIKQDTSSYIVGIRSTYSDWMLSLLEDPSLRNSTGGFSDIVSKITHRIDDKNDLISSLYHSRDRFRLSSDSLYRYFNTNAAFQWRHRFSNKLNNTSSLSVANYKYSLSSNENPVEAFELNYNVRHYAIKSEFNYFPNEKYNLKFGVSSKLYELNPGNKLAQGNASLVSPVTLDDEKALESALFAGAEHKLNKRLSIYTGLRLAIFNSLGPGKQFVYQPDKPKERVFIEDTVYHSNGSIIKTYVRPEIRISGRYKVRDDLSFKFSYDRMNQFIHVLSNTTSISPTDTWRLSSPVIKPQTGDQYSAGFYKTIYGTSLELSIEGYYKKVNNVLEYKDGANLLLNEVLETDIINAKNKAYGLEFLLKKNSGKFTGWLSYTYARSLIKANGNFQSEVINGGEYYPSNFDKPHTFVLVSNFKINRRVNISINMNYSSGRPTTYPITSYNYQNQTLLLYTDRNKFRIPHYFRTDLALNLEGNHKVHKKIHGSWSLSIYNLTSRANAYSVFFQSEGDEIKGYKLSIFKRAIPTITYHFKLQ